MFHPQPTLTRTLVWIDAREAIVADEEDVYHTPEEEGHKPRGSWARWGLISFAIFAVIGLGVGGVVLLIVMRENEKKLAA